MKFIVALACFLFPVVSSLASGIAPAPAPAWELNDLSGEPHRLEDWRGQWVLLKLGRTVCTNCTLELAELGEIQDSVRALGVEVIDIYLREDRYTVKKYWKKKGEEAYRPIVLYDHRDSVIRDYGVSIIPQLILVDPEGQMVWQALYMPGPELLEVLEHYVAGGPPSAFGESSGSH
jgi:peroxiredoxin